MALRDVTQKSVVLVSKKAKLRDVAKLMYHNRVGSVVVVDKARKYSKIPVGVITDRDIAMAYGKKAYFDSAILTKDVMNKTFITCFAEDSINETIKKMKDNGVRRIPVVNKAGELEGIVTLDDLLHLLGCELRSISEIPGLEIRNEERIDKRQRTAEQLVTFPRGVDYSEYPPLI